MCRGQRIYNRTKSHKKQRSFTDVSTRKKKNGDRENRRGAGVLPLGKTLGSRTRNQCKKRKSVKEPQKTKREKRETKEDQEKKKTGTEIHFMSTKEGAKIKEKGVYWIPSSFKSVDKGSVYLLSKEGSQRKNAPGLRPKTRLTLEGMGTSQPLNAARGKLKAKK